MGTNLGLLDRIVRIFVGLLVYSLVFVGPHSLWGLLGVVPLTTGLTGFCPVYQALGWSTCRSGG